MIRVLIVDDQPVVRAGVARILGPHDGFQIVGECDDGDEVVNAVAAAEPDVVLMDVRMRRVDGVTATRELRRRTAPPAVLILTTFDDDVPLGALDAGAAGFVLEDTPAEDLIAATRAAGGGAAWLDPKVTPRVLAVLQRGARGTSDAGARVEQLTSVSTTCCATWHVEPRTRRSPPPCSSARRPSKSRVGAIFAKLGLVNLIGSQR